MRFFHILVTILLTGLMDAFHGGMSMSTPVVSSSSSSVARQSRRPLTPLNYRDHDGDTENYVTRATERGAAKSTASSKQPSTGAHIPTIRSIATSQAAALVAATAATAIALATSGHLVDLGSIHWNGSNAFFSLWDFHLTSTRIVEGVLATVPMIYMGRQIETSDRRDASHVNFSTMNMVMTLFGRREHGAKESDSDVSDATDLEPPETPMIDALLLSSALAIVTSMSEEIVFRGIVPSLIFFFAHSTPIALFGQAFIFGLGHVSPEATAGENRVLSTLQGTNGLWYGMVYLATGGDILPCVIAHALYDTHVFVETWMSINDQMDYTEAAVLKKLSPDDEVEIRKIKNEAGPSLSTETLAYARRFFYAFDYEHKGSLSESDVERAVSYAFLHEKAQPSEARVSELFKKILKQRMKEGNVVRNECQDRLRLTEFLRLIFILKSQTQTA